MRALWIEIWQPTQEAEELYKSRLVRALWIEILKFGKRNTPLVVEARESLVD